MEITVFQDERAMSLKVAEEITAQLRENPRQLLCIAAGFTSLGIFRELARRQQAGEADFSQAAFIAMDEWVGMDACTEGSCGWLLQTEFLSKVNYPAGSVFLWNGKSADADAECRSAAGFIQAHSDAGAIDFLVLGSGMNGHLALNEPGTPLDARPHVSGLDEVTMRVGQKYFETPVALAGGLTLGLADFREAKRTVLTITGRKKAGIVSAVRAAVRFRADLPATAVCEFANASVYCDRDAATEE